MSKMDETVPDMPAALAALVQRMSEAHDINNTTHEMPTTRRLVSTTELLQLVDELYRRYTNLVERTAQSLAAQPQSATTSAGHSNNNNNQEIESHASPAEEEACREVSAALVALQECAAELQRGIRGKLEQTSRLALLGQLQREVAQRRAAVAKMEAVLQLVKQA